MREYDLIADWYATDRGGSAGVVEALAVAALLPRHSRILDAGAGNGVPITEALVNAGHRAVGLDSSAAMAARGPSQSPGHARPAWRRPPVSVRGRQLRRGNLLGDDVSPPRT